MATALSPTPGKNSDALRKNPSTGNGFLNPKGTGSAPEAVAAGVGPEGPRVLPFYFG